MNIQALNELTFYRGRVALYAILKAFDIGKGDQVALQAFTCLAVPEGIMATGAYPLYIDVEANGVNMDADDLSKKITPKTRAIVVQHTFGIPADMERIIRIAQQKSIPVIEDCCHTIVSTYKGKMVGSFGAAAFYSFEWGKPVVTGLGGCALPNETILRNKMHANYDNYMLPTFTRALRIRLQYICHRLLFRPSFYWTVRSLYHKLASLGVAEGNYNPIEKAETKSDDFTFRMPPGLTKLLKRKLNNINSSTNHSRWVVSQYQSLINSECVTPLVLPYPETVFVRYPLVAKNKTSLLNEARKAKVELAGWYSTPIHPVKNDQWHLIHYEADSCTNAEAMSKKIVTLPTHLNVGKRDINRAVLFFKNIARQAI